MPDIRKTLGERVRVLRQSADLTQAELGERAGISVESISRLERGVQLPGIETFYHVALAIGVSFADVFCVSVDARDDILEQLTQQFRALLRNRSVSEGEMALDVLSKIFAEYPPRVIAEKQAAKGRKARSRQK